MSEALRKSRTRAAASGAAASAHGYRAARIDVEACCNPGAQPVQACNSAKAERRANRKRQIDAAKKDVAGMPPGQERDELHRATTRFEENINSVERAQLASNVYNPDSGAPEGWKNISNDPQALAKYGLKPTDLEQPGSQFRAQFYEPDPNVFGDDLKPTVSFKGTTPTSKQDWANNLRQGLDMESPYYQRAVKIGNSLERMEVDVDITGHSLGGGMASAASRASGLPATTFNSAGLHPDTVERYGGSVLPSQITAYRVDGEVLTGLQEQGFKGTLAAAGAGIVAGGPMGALLGGLAKIGLSAGMHDAVGERRALPSSGGNPVTRHGMDQVIAGIESQKSEDQARLSKATCISSRL